MGMTRSQYVSKIASLKEKISEMQIQVKRYEDEVKRLDAARCRRLLEQNRIDPEELEEILRNYRKGSRISNERGEERNAKRIEENENKIEEASYSSIDIDDSYFDLPGAGGKPDVRSSGLKYSDVNSSGE